MKKKILSFVLAFCIIFSMAPAATLPVHAQPTYSVANALAYAAAHWNDGKGLCAEFACNVLNAGGLNMKMQKRVINCIKYAEKASGLTRTALKLTPLKDYKGTTSEMATYALDGDILAPGDLVVQWCHTHNIAPHALICAGYDNQGYAVYYAHNGAMNKKRFQLGDSLAYEHTHNCDMGAYVLHVSSLDPAYAPVEETQPATQPQTEPATQPQTEPATQPQTEPATEPQTEPYVPETQPQTEPATEPQTEPYVPETQAEESIPAGIPDIAITAGAASQITSTTARITGDCEYTMKPSSVGIRLGTSRNSLQTVDADVINHNKNPFDIWYDLSGLTPGTTYYYTLYAIYEQGKAETPVRSFTTKPQEEQAPDLNATGATKITSTTVQVNGTCGYSGQKPSSVGLYFGTSSSSMTKKDSDTINHNKNPFDIWYNLSGLSPDTTYYYQLYAIINGKEYLSSVESFTTKSEENTSSSASTHDITINATKATKVKKNSAQVNGNCSYSGKKPSSVGLYFGTSQSSMSKVDSDTINHNKNPFDIWYNRSNLSPGTTYYYQLYAIVDGVEYTSNILSFTTTK